jgi:hypothetical protein
MPSNATYALAETTKTASPESGVFAGMALAPGDENAGLITVTGLPVAANNGFTERARPGVTGKTGCEVRSMRV